MNQISDHIKNKNVLIKSLLKTPLGQMVAIADHNALYLLEFSNQKNLASNIKKLQEKTKLMVKEGVNQTIHLIKNELEDYFSGKLKKFKTPTVCFGSDFQKIVWQALQRIPYGETRSYADIAKEIGNPKAYRAVARANSTNRIAIIIPCHRVINTNGHLGGYAGGIDRKQSLLDIENT